MFCGYCGVMKRTDNLRSHCRQIHGEEIKALAKVETPKTPQYCNWKSYVDSYPNITAPKDFTVELWRRPDDLSTVLKDLSETRHPSTKNRGEQKA